MQTAEALHHVKLALQVPPSKKVLQLLIQNLGGPGELVRLSDETGQELISTFKMELIALLAADKIPGHVKALYFGMSPVQISDEPSWLHVMGATDFDPDSKRWTKETDDCWLPGNRYFKLRDLHLAMSRLTGTIQHATGLYVAGTLVLQSVDILKSNLPNDEEIPIYVGWDDAELMLIGHVSKSSFRRAF